ncbi:MAG TPA: response regulator transcription factor [Bryobacteraceae bacterium]|nr:response regulator transcription factor [Bryobacteraceae bacterium]
MQAAYEAANGRTRILIVDDDTKLCRLVRDYLEPVGYDVSIANSGPAGIAAAQKEAFAAVILDVMLPGTDGFSVLRAIRAESHVPVLMLTGRGEEPDRVMGLELGADDYLPKTFSTRELLARLRAVIRRSIITGVLNKPEPGAVAVGDLLIDDQARTADLDGEKLQLTAVEFDLLLSLAKAAGRVKTREQLLLEVADRDFDVFDRSIDVHISSLRKKLRDDAKSPRFIVTIRSAGYMMRKPEAGEPS